MYVRVCVCVCARARVRIGIYTTMPRVRFLRQLSRLGSKTKQNGHVTSSRVCQHPRLLYACLSLTVLVAAS
jgi:hypothetical protein